MPCDPLQSVVRLGRATCFASCLWSAGEREKKKGEPFLAGSADGPAFLPSRTLIFVDPALVSFLRRFWIQLEVTCH